MGSRAKYKDTTLTLEERVESLLSEMTLNEKIAQLGCLFYTESELPNCDSILTSDGIGSVAPIQIFDNVKDIATYINEIQRYLVENTRLGIPALFHCEALNGAILPKATTFPMAIGQAASWNADNVEKMAEIISSQMYAVGYRQALSPVFDIARDPRWGRLAETYGEDETLSSAIGVSFVSGLQGNKQKPKVVATGKHFVGHGLTEGGMNHNVSPISERDLREVHCKPFQAAISEGNLMGVMSSYGALNREPVLSSKLLLTDLLRDEMGFEGIVVTDYLSINRLVETYKTAKTASVAGVQALNAGNDIEYPVPYGYTSSLEKAIDIGLISIEKLDMAVKRVLETKMKLNLFEDPYAHINDIDKIMNLSINRSLSLNMAQESIVLLKNSNNLLPLDKKIKKIAVVGPHANTIRSWFGSYTLAASIDSGEDNKNNNTRELSECASDWYQRFPGDLRDSIPSIEKRLRAYYPNSRTLYECVKEYLPDAEVTYALGINVNGNNIANFEDAVCIAAEADVIILTLGGQHTWGIVGTNGEGVDNYNIDLPGKQEEFARAIRELFKKTVVVHIDGRPLINKYVCSHFDAIIECWHPGEMGGQAIASVLFGEYNPGGKLPVSATRHVGQIPTYYSSLRGTGYMSAGKFGITQNKFGYANATAQPLYPFGYGLSYTKFEYSNIRISNKRVCSSDTVLLSIDIKNIGEYDGDEVVQLYFSDYISSIIRPDLILAGFKRIHLKQGEKKTLKFIVSLSQLAFLDIDMRWKVEAGMMSFLVGASSEDIRQTIDFEILDDKFVDGKNRGFFAKTMLE